MPWKRFSALNVVWPDRAWLFQHHQYLVKMRCSQRRQANKSKSGFDSLLPQFVNESSTFLKRLGTGISPKPCRASRKRWSADLGATPWIWKPVMGTTEACFQYSLRLDTEELAAKSKPTKPNAKCSYAMAPNVSCMPYIGFHHGTVKHNRGGPNCKGFPPWAK